VSVGPFFGYYRLMAKQTNPTDDFDSPWKEALDEFLEAFLAFFFPTIHSDVDWTRGYVALDKEFQQIIREADSGKQLADKLFKVWLKDGEEQWLLIHVEVQGAVEAGFALRMFRYNIRAFEQYNREVASLAVLTDSSPNWRPDQFAYGRWGSKTGIIFPVVKLLDFAKDSEALEQSANPFAAVVLAHLKALETRKEPLDRRHWKLHLVKGLFQRNWSMEDVRRLFRLIDWIMALPAELQEAFRRDVYEYEETQHMPYLSIFERQAMAEGLEQGREQGLEQGLEKGLEQGLKKGVREGLVLAQEGILLALETKFGPAGRKLAGKVKRLREIGSLRALKDAIGRSKSIDEIRQYLAQHS
jgi:hypothetical protein